MAGLASGCMAVRLRAGAAWGSGWVGSVGRFGLGLGGRLQR